MFYLHEFETISEFDAYYDGDGYIEPWVSLTVENGEVRFNKMPGLELSTEKIVASQDAGTENVTVSSNGTTWTAATTDSWISISPSTGGGGQTNVTLSLSLALNSREGSVTFTDGNGNSVVLTVSQNNKYAKPLTFGIISAGTLTVMEFYGYPEELYYSTDNGLTWTKVEEYPLELDVEVGDKIMFKGVPGSYSSGYGEGEVRFGGTAYHYIEGNIMSLMNFAEDFKIPSEYEEEEVSYYRGCFNTLFAYDETLISAANLGLPNAVAQGCYEYMFDGCIRMTAAPDLPCMNLYDETKDIYDMGHEYCGMFYGCTSLTVAPVLPSETVTENGYSSMFYGCSALTTPPPSIGGVNGSIYEEGCRDMFLGCTSLVTAPNLPIHNFVGTSEYSSEGHYSNMFNECTSLTGVTIGATDMLPDNMANGMFMGCSSLSYIDVSNVNDVSSNAVHDWVNGVAASGTFVKKANMQGSWPEGSIPENWTVEEAS